MIRPTHLVLLIASVVAAPGCTTLNVSRLWSSREAVEDATTPVTEVMCLWEAAEGTGLDGLPTRGFAGQILFFSGQKKQPSPLKVEGDVRIFVFDDEGVRGDKSQPIHQFDFPGAAWNQFMASTNFGTTYQLFIPYTKPGAHHADCEIRVRYTPVGGNPVFSRPCMVTLTGSPRGKGTARTGRPSRAPTASMIQQAAYESESTLTATNPPSLQVPPSPSSVAAASNVRARTLHVDRLNHIANALAEERAGLQSSTNAPALGASDEPSPTSTRRRLNPLAGESPAPAAEEPVSPATVPEERAKHILDSE